MSQTKYRIPKVAMAVMVLGANGCGDDDGSKSGGSGSDSRYDAVSQNICKPVGMCGGSGSQAACVNEFNQIFKSDFDASNTACKNAFLVYYECYVKNGCDIDDTGCETLYDAYQKACDKEPLGQDTGDDEELP